MQQFSKFIAWSYFWLSMFQASYRPSSGAYICPRSLCFYMRCSMKDVALLVVVGQNILLDNDQQR